MSDISSLARDRRAASAENGTGLTRSGLAALLFAYFPVNFTFGSVNLLAGSIGADLRAQPAVEQLILASYTTVFAAALVIAGRLGDRYGRRRMMVAGILIFTLFAAAAAFAPNALTLVVSRVGLGVGAGLVTPQVLSIIQATASGRRRTTGIILFAAMSGVSTVAGQLVAGAVMSVAPDHLGWRVVQLVTAAIAVAGLPGLRRVRESRSAAALVLDARGAILLGTGLLAVVVPLTLGRPAGWPLWTVVSLVLGAVVLAIFWGSQIRLERAGSMPVVPPSVLAYPAVRRGLLMTLLFFMTYGAFLYEFSAFAHGRLGLDTRGVSLLVLGFGIAFIFTSLLLPRLVPFTGPHTMTVAAVAQSLVLLGLGAEVGWTRGDVDYVLLNVLLVLLGMAQACMYGPVLQTVLSQTPSWAAGVAGGLFTTLQQLGLSLGVALLGGVFWSVAGTAASPGAVDLPLGLAVVFVIHAVCALVFAALARSVAKIGSPAE